MADDDMDGPWVTDWDEIDGVVDEDDDVLEDEYLGEDFEDEYIDEPVTRPARTVPLAAAPAVGGVGGDGYGDGYDDGYEDEGDGRRRRALLVVAGALLFVLVGAALAAILVNQDDDGVETNAASSSSSSTSTTRVTPSSLGGLPGQQPAPGASSSVPSGSSSTSTSKATTSTTKAATTTTTEAPDGPACSPTGSTPPSGGNLPMKVAFCIDDPTPKVGQSVTVSGTAEDLDGGVTLDCVKISWEGEEFGECFPPQAEPAESFNESYSFRHTFARPGTYTIHVGAQSGKPEGSFAETTLRITVHA